MKIMNELIFKDLGLIAYSDAYRIQNELFKRLIKKKQNGENTSGTVLFCEHPHVYTVGKSGNHSNLLISEKELKKIHAEYFPVDRGGDITYHGPGQLVMYPIIDLDNYGAGVKDYIYFLEYLIIDILRDYGIEGEINKGNIGVWLDVGKAKERKICSIGVKVSRKITMHGIALNVHTDLSYFDYINPCGFTDKSVTSLKRECSVDVELNDLKIKIKENFLKRLIILKK